MYMQLSWNVSLSCIFWGLFYMQARPICENRLADFASVAHIDSTDDKYIQLSGNLHMHIYIYMSHGQNKRRPI